MNVTEARQQYRAARARASIPREEFDRRAGDIARELAAAGRYRTRVQPWHWVEAAEILALPEPQEKRMETSVLSPKLPPMTCLEPACPEWTAAWLALAEYNARHWGARDHVAEDHDSGEVWQYMCSFFSGGKWWHEFRHRAHPVARRRDIAHVPASLGYAPEVK